MGPELDSALRQVPGEFSVSARVDVLIREGLPLRRLDSRLVAELRRALGRAIFYAQWYAYGGRVGGAVFEAGGAGDGIDRPGSGRLRWTPREIARRVGASEGHLRRLFRQELGVSLMEVVWRRRCEAARPLLKNTALSVEEVSERCGFQSLYHFSRRFRAYAGVSPSRCRE